MKAVIKEINFDKEVNTKYGIMFSYYVTYNDRTASFLCKQKDKYSFKVGVENEFIETSKEYNGKLYYHIKAITPNAGNSNYGKALKREQSRYAGFAMSYAKDLVVHDKIKLEDMSTYTKKMFELMVELDKTLES